MTFRGIKGIMKQYLSNIMIDRNIGIHIFKLQEKNSPKELHTHDFIEIVYVMQGKAMQTVNGKTFSVRRGDLLFMNYKSTHYFEYDEDFEYLNICLAPSLTQKTLPYLSLLDSDELKNSSELMCHFAHQERFELEKIFEIMLSEYDGKNFLYKNILDDCMSILLAKIIRKVYFNNMEEKFSYFWEEVADYIEENIGSDLTLSSLSQKYFYNPSYFSRSFKNKFNVTLTEYISNKRVQSAIQMLENTNLPVYRIAEELGYKTTSSFYKAFHKITGKTVAEFKNNN